MESLYQDIDDLIDTDQLSGKRNGNFVFIDLKRSNRKQKVHLAANKDSYILSSVVARANDVSEPTAKGRNGLLFRIWRRNALKPVVSLAIDRRDRVVGTITCPTDTTHVKEILFYLVTLARDCDRFEYILSGLDQN